MLRYAPLNAARELGLYNVWETIGEQEVIWRPPTPGESCPEHERALRALHSLELDFHMKVLADLRSGELLAFGLRLPLKPSSVPTPIPPGLWYFIAFDTDKRTADGGSWFFREVRTISVRSLRPSDRHELDLALGIIARRLETGAAGHDDEPAAAPGKPAEGPLGATPDNPLYVSLAGADERLVLKTETLRRNTRHGKVPNPKPEAAEPPKADAEAPPQSVDPEEPPKPKRSGPKTLNPEIKAYLEERSEKKICKESLAEECVHLRAWAKKNFAQEIRTKKRKLAGLKQLREEHAAVYYQLNPEFDRRRRFQQESNS